MLVKTTKNVSVLILYNLSLRYYLYSVSDPVQSKPFLSDAGVLASAGSHGNSSLPAPFIARMPSLPSQTMVPQQPPYFGNRPPSYSLPSFPPGGTSQQFQCNPVHIGVPVCVPAPAPSALAGSSPFSTNLDRTRFVHDSRDGNRFSAPSDGIQRQADANSSSSHPPGFDVRHTNFAMRSQSDFSRQNTDGMPRLAYPSTQNPWPQSHHLPVYPHVQHQNSLHPHHHSHTPQHFHPQHQQTVYSHPIQNFSVQYHSDSCNQQKMPFQGITPQEQLHRQLLPVSPPSYIQGCDVKSTAIGVPIGKPVYMENPYAIASPSYPLSSAMMGALPQPSLSTVVIPQACQEKKSQMNIGDGHMCPNGNQYPSNLRSNSVHSNDLKPHTVHPYANYANGYMVSSCKTGTEISMDASDTSNGQRNNQQQVNDEIGKNSNICAINQNQSTQHGEPFCAAVKGNDQNFPVKWQESVANGRKHSSIRRDNNNNSEMAVKFNRNQQFPRRNQNGCHYSKNLHGNHQRLHDNEYRDSHFNKGMGGRSINQKIHRQMRCEPCDRTFRNRLHFDSHFKSHVKCGEEGCTFEASGRIVKEHKVVQHGKSNTPTTAIGRRALELRLVEDEKEVKRWREERKRNYPTTANILRKLEQKKSREAAGVSFDEEMQSRCEQMRKVLARQKELGFEVAEIPSKYLSSNGKGQRLSRNLEYGTVPGRKAEVTNKRPYSKAEPISRTSDRSQNNDDSQRVKKQQNKECFPRQKRRRQHLSPEAHNSKRQPTLLSKLLGRDIEKETSYLLQCCRFIVNNDFLQSSSLKHFQWIDAAASASTNGTTGDDMSISVQDGEKRELIEPPQILADNISDPDI